MLTKAYGPHYAFLERRNRRHRDSINCRVAVTMLGTNGKENDIDEGKKD
jgi:hypothetical protein